ncbi:MAG TPA: hypothetical protein VGU19_05500 [Microvirga sp.]|jgi:hypothetical protein|nr:hypothetical protein [Microvirga sp.]
MGENVAIFKRFDGFSRGKAQAEIRLRFSNLLPDWAKRPADQPLWHFRRAAGKVK